MKINTSAEWVGNEMIVAFKEQLKAANIEADVKDIKIMVQKPAKEGEEAKEVEITPNRLRLVYEKVQV